MAQIEDLKKGKQMRNTALQKKKVENKELNVSVKTYQKYTLMNDQKENNIPLPDEIVQYSALLYEELRENQVGRFLMEDIEVNGNWIDTRRIQRTLFEHGRCAFGWDGEDLFYGHPIPDSIKYDLNHRIKEFRLMAWIDGKFVPTKTIYKTQGENRNGWVIDNREYGLPTITLASPLFGMYDRAWNALNTNVLNLNDKKYVAAILPGSKDAFANDVMSPAKLRQMEGYANSVAKFVPMPPATTFLDTHNDAKDFTSSIYQVIEKLEAKIRTYCGQPGMVSDKKERMLNQELTISNDNSDMLMSAMKSRQQEGFAFIKEFTNGQVDFKYKEADEELIAQTKGQINESKNMNEEV